MALRNISKETFLKIAAKNNQTHCKLRNHITDKLIQFTAAFQYDFLQSLLFLIPKTVFTLEGKCYLFNIARVSQHRIKVINEEMFFSDSKSHPRILTQVSVLLGFGKCNLCHLVSTAHIQHHYSSTIAQRKYKPNNGWNKTQTKGTFIPYFIMKQNEINTTKYIAHTDRKIAFSTS